jgi:RNA polymerase sigma-70 factor (ECF subfamily)
VLLAGAAGEALAMADIVRAELEAAMRRGYVAAFRMLGTADESREACQEAAARALSARQRYDPSQPFYPWFYRILKNHCLDRLRGRRRWAPSTTEPGELPASASSSAESSLAEAEQTRAVTEAIQALPADLREIIELRHFQDLSYDEMAVVLGCPLGTVMSRLYRARKKLRELLLQEQGTGGASDREEARR